MYQFKYGYIYKITNLVNNKIYIGQVYNKSIEDRFNRHCDGATANSKSYLGRAIHKYGKNNFKIEQIEECYSVKELNEREIYWISYYNSTNGDIGYNLTPGGEGGNTYLCKSNEEMSEIKSKISNALKGKHNGMSNQLKIKSIITNKEYHFETLGETLKFFNVKNKDVIMDRANEKINTLYHNEWLIAFENNDYKNYEYPLSATWQKVKCTNLYTNEEYIFNSITKLCKTLNIKRPFFNNKIAYIDQYKIEVL